MFILFLKISFCLKLSFPEAVLLAVLAILPIIYVERKFNYNNNWLKEQIEFLLIILMFYLR